MPSHSLKQANLTRSTLILVVCFAALFVLGLALPGFAESIWVEGEAASKHSFVKHNWYDAVDKSVMSGKQWLSHYHDKKSGEATYTINVSSAATYAFWLRANPFRVEMDYRIDGGAWKQISFDAMRDRMMISKNPDHRFIAWVKIDDVKLSAGRHTVEFRIRSKLANHGGIDCFVLTDEPFVPSGVGKPGAKFEAGPDVWFPVIAGDDKFSDQSVIDMSHLLHTPAGKFGHLKRVGDRLKFERATEPIKFWGCGANVRSDTSKEVATQRARYLAKHGVNMVRQHSVFGFLGPLQNGKFDAKKLDRFDWWFAELKKHGIYTTWSVFYPLIIGPGDGYPRELFAELENGRTYGLVNISRPLQDLQLEYLRALLTHRNPYTRMAYKDDPALAVVEVQNEDCVFFHFPLNNLAGNKPKFPKHAALLRKGFAEWAKTEYGTTAKLRQAWGTRDSIEAGELPVYGAWQLKGDKVDKRQGDFIRFLTQLQRGFYERRENEIRAIGYEGVTVTTAWRSGGPGADAANLYCDTAMDMIDRHNYFGGGAGRHRITTGKVNNGTHLDQLGKGILSIGMYQVQGHPFACTEWNQNPPNQWRAEISPLVAFYGMGLQGWDASYHFLNSRPRMGDGWPGLSYYVTDTPLYIGQFPALAFALHREHIREGAPVAVRRVSEAELFTGKDPLAQDFTGGGHDDKSIKASGTPIEALAMGRVLVDFAKGEDEHARWSNFHDTARKIVRSNTWQLEWRYGERVVLLKGPKTHAVVGFAGGRKIACGDVEVTCKTLFVSLLLTPLDDEPLQKSKRILITAMARDKQTGTRYNEKGTELLAIGGPPLLMEPVQASIKLPGEPIRRARPLDIYGVPRDKAIETTGTTLKIDGNSQAYYYLVER